MHAYVILLSLRGRRFSSCWLFLRLFSGGRDWNFLIVADDQSDTNLSFSAVCAFVQRASAGLSLFGFLRPFALL